MATYLRATCQGFYTTGTWAGERAQCGYGLMIAEDDPETTPVVNATIGEWAYDDDSAVGAWDHGTYVRGFGGDLLDDTNQKVIANAFWSWMSGCKSFLASTFRWQTVTLSLQQYDAIPPTGWGQKYAPSVFTISGSGIQGTLTTPAGPPQSTVVVSHMTDGAGGRNRGRVYVPFHGGTDNSQLLTSGVLTALSGNEVALFHALAAGVDLDTAYVTPAVISRQYRTYSTITAVRVGDEVDTQRRRRNARNEVYTSYPVPAP